MAEVVIAARGGPHAKSRCKDLLDPLGRDALTRAMLEDMLEAALAVPGVDRVWVVTPTSDLAAMAARAGAAVMLETQALGLTEAFEYALTALARIRPHGVIVLLPGDLPLLDPDELAALVAAHHEGEVILAPAATDNGTGAIVLTAGCDFQFAWGLGSLPRHVAAAKAAGLTARIIQADSLAFDLDRPADVRALLARKGGAKTRDVLSRALKGREVSQTYPKHSKADRIVDRLQTSSVRPGL